MAGAAPARPTPAHRSRGRLELAAVAGILAFITVVGFVLAAGRGHFNWDEAVYASQARSLITDIPFDWFQPHRPPGLALIGLLAAPTSFNDFALRGLTVLLGVLTLAILWALTRSVWGSIAGLVALVAAIATPVVLREIAQFHNDLISAGVVMLVLLLLWDQLERRTSPTPLLLLAGVGAAAAFHLRFGVLPGLVGVAITAVVLWPATLWQHRRLVAATAALAVILVVPHFISSIQRTGSPLGILMGATEVVNTSDPVSTLRQYLLWLPRSAAGLGPMLLIALGVAHAIALVVTAIRTRRTSQHLRRQILLLGPALVSAGGVTLISHPEQRYIVLPILLGLAAGAGTVGVLLGSVSRAREGLGRYLTVPSAAAGAVIALIGLSGFFAGRQALAVALRPPPQDWIDAGALIDRDTDGDCLVVSTIQPIIGWYSFCDAAQFTSRALADAEGGGRRPVYVLFTDLDDERTGSSILATYRALVQDGSLRPVGRSGGGRATVYRLER